MKPVVPAPPRWLWKTPLKPRRILPLFCVICMNPEDGIWLLLSASQERPGWDLESILGRDWCMPWNCTILYCKSLQNACRSRPKGSDNGGTFRWVASFGENTIVLAEPRIVLGLGYDSSI